jgi:hypothetical protein
MNGPSVAGIFAAGRTAQVFNQELRVQWFSGTGLHDFIHSLLSTTRVEFLPQELARSRTPVRAKPLVQGQLDLTGNHVRQDKALKIDGVGTVHA